MFPDRCSVMESKIQCPSPPEFVVSVVHQKDEYMVGVTCERHRQAVAARIRILQDQGKVPGGKVRFTGLKAVGTDCIRGDEDDYIQIDSEKQK